MKQWIDQRVNDGCINYFVYDEFNNLETLCQTVKKANWEDRNITVALKFLNNFNIPADSDLKEFIIKLKALRIIYFNQNINRFYGITKDSDGNYFSILEYANEGNLRDYLKNKFSKLQWDDKVHMALDITGGLMCLHSKKIIHGDLYAHNILVHHGALKIAGFGLFKQLESTLASENLVYVEPHYLRDKSYKRDMKSDIYSLGILLWELSSGRPPFSNYVHDLAQLGNKVLVGLREDQIENTPLGYVQLYQKCWQDDPNIRPTINEVYNILSHLKSQINKTKNEHHMDLEYKEMSIAEIFGSSLNKQQIIEQFRINHGLILTGESIRPSKQAIISENGELKMNVYEGQPIVYTYINYECDNDESSDICINFPIAEIIYNGNLQESFSKYMDIDDELYELYGHFLASKFLVGNQLFIQDFNLANSTQRNILKFYLFHVYNLAKCSAKIQMNSIFTLNLLPKIVTLDGKELDTHEKFVKWMNELHQKKSLYLSSYDDLIPISQLRSSSIDESDESEIFNEKQPGVADFKEKLSLEEWLGNAIHNNLMSWARDFQLFQGLKINNNYKIENSKKNAFDFIKIPKVNLQHKYCLKIINPQTKLGEKLISNNIFTYKSTTPFSFIKSNDENCGEYNHALIKCEQYEILLNKNHIKPTKKFEEAVAKALNSINPVKDLQNIFNEYGHLFSRRIVLGRSLKNIFPNISSSNTFNDSNGINEIFESLNKLDISYFLTQKGKIIEKNDLFHWIQTTNNHLEIIELDDIIHLYKILKAEQQKQIDDILNNNFRIILTGITDLKDLNSKNVEHYKRINLESSLGNEDYKVFGSIISENNLKLEEFYVDFGLYDFNGFCAIIKKIKETSIDVTKCNVFWMIIGNPLKLSALSPHNRDVLVKCFKGSISLQPNQLNYHIKVPFPLLQRDTIFFNAPSKEFGHGTIELINWTYDSIDIKFILFNNSYDQPNINNIDLNICILSSYFENLNIDNRKEECSLNLIGVILTESLFTQQKEESDVNYIFIKTIGKPTPKLDRLNLTDNLSNIRLELIKRNIIDETLAFSKKTPENEFAEIERENEEIFFLKNIIDDVNSCYFLYLIKNSRPSWKILNEKCKLDYGCTMSFDGIKKADKRAFIMKDCELTEIKTGGYERDKLEFESKEDWMKKTNLFIEGDCDDVNILNFVKLGLSSIKGLKDENFDNEVKSTYQYTELAKVSLRVSKKNLVLTEDFENDINDAIESKDPRKFRKITKRYGQFIPTEIILGGRVYTKDTKISLESSADNSIEGSVNTSVGPLNLRSGYNYNNSCKKSKFYSSNRMKILGGRHPNDENFDEKTWIESLEDYQIWDCIEYKDPISIFQFLPDDLRKKTIESIGKRILYTSTEDYDYELYELGRHGIFELKNLPNLPDNIFNEEADSDVFATVVDTGEDSNNVFFNCQILKKQKARPSIIIHGIIQEKFKQLKYQLKIKIMIIGFDIYFNHILSDTSVFLYKDEYKTKSSCLFDSMNYKLEYELITGNIPFLGIPILNRLDSSNNSIIIGHNFCNIQSNNKFRIDTFSYCVKNKRYVNLPDFSFCILIISNNTTQSFPFEFGWWNKPYINFNEPNPRYVSLYLTKDINYSPIFLNQKSKQITIEYVKCDCDNTCSICKNKTLKITAYQNDAECKVYSIS
ncbi:uncharacterized protein OCT59_019176 [Rhizophagus irregularis]|nr:Sps1p [Rhizophagus irregularis DAOM 197198w]UZO26966.1 hypothetical protein OCT59_019176 [Rhizophagus irregularis]GBC33911.1 hypothetical protein GLOIN_2v759589 [Rhizophagus irregularis DAOM 181602=DAOM 197198]